MSETPHIPVLLQDVVTHLAVAADDIVLDGTLGFGGHAQALMATLGPQGRYIGLDTDPAAIEFCRQRFQKQPNCTIVHARYPQFRDVLSKAGIPNVNVMLLDLGISSFQLDHPERGFTFQGNAPLDMRMNPDPDNQTGADILNTYSKEALITMFTDWGELRRCEKLVDKIIENRPVTTVDQLIWHIKKGFYFNNNRKLYMSTCAQVFQAIRIEVNQELEALDSFLEHCLDVLAPGGRVGIISFHSLEDRRVKQFIKAHKFELTQNSKHVIQATQEEIRQNPRSRSAKLRVFTTRSE